VPPLSRFSNQPLVSLGPLSQKLLSSHRRVWSGPHRQVAPSVIIEREQRIQEKIEEQTASGRTISSVITKTVTGLTVTIGSIVTLFILLQATAKVDWSQIFHGSPVPRT
jgi:hypothetical protein